MDTSYVTCDDPIHKVWTFQACDGDLHRLQHGAVSAQEPGIDNTQLPVVTTKHVTQVPVMMK